MSKQERKQKKDNKRALKQFVLPSWCNFRDKKHLSKWAGKKFRSTKKAVDYCFLLDLRKSNEAIKNAHIKEV